jgi:uncharacterized protein YjeT (DUF2065 family)
MEGLFKRMSISVSRASARKPLEHLDQISSNHVRNYGKNEVLIGVIVLKQEWTFL